jgi:hypothetical protein
MSLHYTQKITYLIEEIANSNFDFKEFTDTFKSNLLESDIFPKISKLKLQLEITCPDYEIFHDLYQEGKIKSHEVEATTDKVKDSIKYAISNLMYKLHYTIDRYWMFRDAIKIQRLEYLVQNPHTRGSDRQDVISMEFNLRILEIRDVISILKLWSLDEFAFAKELKINVFVQKKGINEFDDFKEYTLNKKEFGEISEFLSVDDIEYLVHPTFYEILKTYMFPDNFLGNAEITLDVAKPDKSPQKRRTVTVRDTKMKFHQLITKNTPYESYKEVIQENDIVGIYCSVRSTNNDLLYLLIDIDISTLLSNIFSPQIIWELTLNIAKEINRVAQSLGLPPFKMIYSGSRGIHLLYAMDYDAISDIERQVNLPVLADNTLLPGLTSLKKEKISSLNDKFKFAKTLMQSILLHTVYKGNIQIPFDIRRKLKITQPYQLFRLAIETKNCLSILLDCSSVSKGVFRLFSPHPRSKLISIPISDVEENSFCEKYESYKSLVEDAKIGNVIEMFDKNEAKLFFQRPHTITRDHIKNLLHPEMLFPSFAVLLRFGTTYAMNRSLNSFNFWFRFYELKGFYNYVYNRILNNGTPDNAKLRHEVEAITIKMDIDQKDKILDLLECYFRVPEFSVPLFLNCLNILYYHEFFFRLKSNSFIQENKENLVELFKNKYEFGNFLRQTEHTFTIVVNLLIDIILSKDNTNHSQEQETAIEIFENEASVLLDLAQYSLGETRDTTDPVDQGDQLIDIIHFVSKLYSTSVKFLNQYIQHDERE